MFKKLSGVYHLELRGGDLTSDINNYVKTFCLMFSPPRHKEDSNPIFFWLPRQVLKERRKKRVRLKNEKVQHLTGYLSERTTLWLPREVYCQSSWLREKVVGRPLNSNGVDEFTRTFFSERTNPKVCSGIGVFCRTTVEVLSGTRS